ncbi:MAG: Asr1405/Asl0597 family protein [Phormidesmis sp.]
MSSSNLVPSFRSPADRSCAAATCVTVCCEDRWQVYHRLQSLDIECRCGGFQPLIVDVKTAADAIQLWSIVNRVSGSRQALISRLTQSWKLPCPHRRG